MYLVVNVVSWRERLNRFFSSGWSVALLWLGVSFVNFFCPLFDQFVQGVKM